MRKRGCLGCSFPVVIGLGIVLLGMLVIGFLAGPLGKAMIPGLSMPAWLTVAQPKPELAAESIFHIFNFPITNSIIGAWVTIIFLVVFSWVVLP